MQLADFSIILMSTHTRHTCVIVRAEDKAVPAGAVVGATTVDAVLCTRVDVCGTFINICRTNRGKKIVPINTLDPFLVINNKTPMCHFKDGCTPALGCG
jgi:hypothetical protein